MHKPEKEGAEGNSGRLIVVTSNNEGVAVNYCPVCKREYKQKSGYQTGRCPACGSTLVQLSDDAITHVRRENTRKKG